jgi:SAM-dependent methyltransferase
MNPSRRLFATAIPLLLAACAQPRQPREDFKPVVGQDGKDVIWVPTPDAVVQRMLDMAEVRAGDRVVDLGSGDGKIAIAAARRGAIARGIEYNADMVALSRRLAREQGVQVGFTQGDIFASDFHDADVVTLYLLPNLNQRLRPILLNMRPGTRVTSHQFGMGDWEPDRTDEIGNRRAHLWIVPAKVAGHWILQLEGEPPIPLQLQQQYQQFWGSATVAGQRVPVDAPRIRGGTIRFELRGAGGPMRLEGTADSHGYMTGTAALPGGATRRFTAVRS